MFRGFGRAVFLGVVVVGGVVAGCGANSGRASMGAVAAGAEPPRAFEEKFLDAAREHVNWKRVFQGLKWAQIQCAPFTPEQLLGTRAPRLSASKEETTHGQKLFWLHAKEIGAYQDAFAYNPPSDLTAPIGQVLVKQSWSMKPVEKSWVDEGENRAKCAQQDGVWYAADEPRELFIMLKKAKSVQGTDGGWAYGVVTADGSKVVRSGLLQDCMGCHKAAKHDRQLGLEGAGK